VSVQTLPALARGELKPKGPRAQGRTLPIFDETKPPIRGWLVRLAVMLKVKDPKAIDPATPLLLSRVHNKDGSPRAIARETAWLIIKAIARENQFPGKIGTHSVRKTLCERSYQNAKSAGMEDPLRFCQKILGHKSISSTEHYRESITAEAAWEGFRQAMRGRAA
jgi:integrase